MLHVSMMTSIELLGFRELLLIDNYLCRVVPALCFLRATCAAHAVGTVATGVATLCAAALVMRSTSCTSFLPLKS